MNHFEQVIARHIYCIPFIARVFAVMVECLYDGQYDIYEYCNTHCFFMAVMLTIKFFLNLWLFLFELGIHLQALFLQIS